MSWSVTLVGKPSKVSEALSAYSEKLSGVSKQEYDEVLPHLKALVDANLGDDKFIKVSANGHASFNGNEKVSSYCIANVEAVYGLLV